MGLVMWADKVADSDAPVVNVLRKAGAVVYVKTTMPQTGMVDTPCRRKAGRRLTSVRQAIETVSNLWGRTLNPANTLLTPGGSSGREGALLGCLGSPLGIGTDIGGSIRVPASFNGLYAIKPTSRRGTYVGNMNNSTSGSPIWSAMGPMGRSVRDLELICRLLCQGQPWLVDPRVAYKPWCAVPALERVTVGVMWWDEVVMPHPPVLRALRMTVDALRAAGHEGAEKSPGSVDRWLTTMVVSRRCYALQARDREGDCGKKSYRVRMIEVRILTFQTTQKRLSFPTGGGEIRQSLGSTGEPWTKAVERCLAEAKSMDLSEFLRYSRSVEVLPALKMLATARG
jgi:Asp-tRNA(Asn)/Glu-tRNA(Gln) amidotransferase A subunit family amidase